MQAKNRTVINDIGKKINYNLRLRESYPRSDEYRFISDQKQSAEDQVKVNQIKRKSIKLTI